jgi:hypothetical protein
MRKVRYDRCNVHRARCHVLLSIVSRESVKPRIPTVLDTVTSALADVREALFY